jgi:hypothetical protein
MSSYAIVEEAPVGNKLEIMPSPCDGGINPSVEWWDEAFLPKNIRENRKRSRVAADHDDTELLAINNTKTFK